MQNMQRNIFHLYEYPLKMRPRCAINIRRESSKTRYVNPHHYHQQEVAYLQV